MMRQNWNEPIDFKREAKKFYELHKERPEKLPIYINSTHFLLNLKSVFVGIQISKKGILNHFYIARDCAIDIETMVTENIWQYHRNNNKGHWYKLKSRKFENFGDEEN